MAKICLFSSDHIKSQDELEIKVKQIKDHEYDIIIGTQLITKGYHFPNLACVGIIDADMTLKGGDLRASEKLIRPYTKYPEEQDGLKQKEE